MVERKFKETDPVGGNSNFFRSLEVMVERKFKETGPVGENNWASWAKI